MELHQSLLGRELSCQTDTGTGTVIACWVAPHESQAHLGLMVALGMENGSIIVRHAAYCRSAQVASREDAGGAAMPLTVSSHKPGVTGR